MLSEAIDVYWDAVDPFLAAAASVEQGNCYLRRASALALVEKSSGVEISWDFAPEDQTLGKNNLYICSQWVVG